MLHCTRQVKYLRIPFITIWDQDVTTNWEWSPIPGNAFENWYQKLMTGLYKGFCSIVSFHSFFTEVLLVWHAVTFQRHKYKQERCGERQSMWADIQDKILSYTVCFVHYKFSACVNLSHCRKPSVKNLSPNIFVCVHAVSDMQRKHCSSPSFRGL